MTKAKKGLYKPQNPEKYRGDPNKIIYRSLWELKVMRRLDTNPQVVWWSSERVAVRYLDKTTGQTRNYYPDFLYGRRRLADDPVVTVMAEVKPSKESPDHVPAPVRRKGQSEVRYLREALTWAKNLCKWNAAKAYCAKKGWDFIVLTEKELGIR
jgi:hypothetical protein